MTEDEFDKAGELLSRRDELRRIRDAFAECEDDYAARAVIGRVVANLETGAALKAPALALLEAEYAETLTKLKALGVEAIA